MQKRGLVLAVCGFLVGSAAFAVGQAVDEDLRDGLRYLQESAELVIREVPISDDYEPSVGSGQRLGLFSIFDLVCPVPDFIPPQEGYVDEDSETPVFGWEAEEAYLPFGTPEELLELVRCSVRPESWEDGASLTVTGQTLVVWHRPEVIAEIGRYLDGLRARALRCVAVEARIVEVSTGLHDVLARGSRAGLDAGQTKELEEALARGDAHVLFGARATGLVQQRFVVWHGHQHAVLLDTDVEVAQEAKTSDPIVDVVRAGGCICARPMLGEDTGRITLELELRAARLEQPVRPRETFENGTLDMPAVERVGYTTTLVAPRRTWTLVGGGERHGERVIAMLVRATLLEAEGERR